MKKILFASGVVLLLAAGCSGQTAVNSTEGTQPAMTENSQQQQAQPTKATSTANLNMSGSSSTNADLNSSLGNIDTQMNSLNSDSASMDSSIGEQQTP